MKKFTIENNIGEALKDFPVCNYFVNTYMQCEKRTSLSWLKIIDNKNLSILNDYARMSVEPVNEKEANQFLQNTDLTNFKNDLDLIYPDNSIEAFAMLDFTALTLMLIEFEGNKECSKEILDGNNVKLIEDSCIALSILITFEAMRRHGTATIEGNGKITNFKGRNGTKIVLTEKGKAYSDSIDTMKKISEMMEE